MIAAPWLEVVLVLAAVVAGAIIGMERERHDKPAGLRTLVLVCLGSCVFTLSSYAFTTSTGDSGRVAAQIVTGIGFLGAGAILHARSGITGMTTAAAIWITAAVGLTIGTGHAAAGLAAALLIRLLLAALARWEIRHLGGMRAVTLELVLDPDHGKTRLRIDQLREVYRVAAQVSCVETRPDGTVHIRFEVRLPRRHLHEFLATLADLPAIREIHTAPG